VGQKDASGGADQNDASGVGQNDASVGGADQKEASMLTYATYTRAYVGRMGCGG